MRESNIRKREEKIREAGSSWILQWLVRNRSIALFTGALLDALTSLTPYAELYLVGGSVRDLLEGKKRQKDLDFMVTNLTFEELGNGLGSIKGSEKSGIRDFVSAGKHFPVYKVSVCWMRQPIDVALARSERSTGDGHRDFVVTTSGIQAREDSERRDFTINAMFFKFDCIEDKINGTIVDNHGGISSIARKEIKAVGNPEDRFAEDPLRMLRAIRQKNERKGFVIETETWNAICRLMPALIHTISAERIAEELMRSLRANRIQTWLDWKNSGALQQLIPEIADLTAAEHDVLLKRFDYLNFFGSKKDLTPALLVACLLCDTAVRECEEKLRKGSEKLSKGRSSFLHDYREASFYNLKTPESIARRMALPHLKEIRNLLNDFVRLMHYKQLTHRRAVAEKILSGNPLAPQILLLYRAHQKAKIEKKVDFDFLMDKFLAVPRYVGGRDFLDRGFLPGPHTSYILEAIRERELWDEIKSKEEAIEYGVALFKEQIMLYEEHCRKLKELILVNLPVLGEAGLVDKIGAELGGEIRELLFADCLKLLELYYQEELLRYTFRELYELFLLPVTEPHYYFKNYYDATMRSLRILLEEEPEVPQCVVIALTLLDIGKAHTLTGDHISEQAITGARLSEQLCHRLGFDKSLEREVSFLIRHHTIFFDEKFEKEIISLIQKSNDEMIHNLILVCYYAFLGRFDPLARHKIAEMRKRIKWINKNRALWKREYLEALER